MTLVNLGDIHISSNGNELVCFFPLTVEAGLVESRFANLLTKMVRPASTTLIITLTSPVDLDKSRHLKTKLWLKDYRRITEPVLHAGPLRKNLTSMIDTLLSEEKQVLTAMLDRDQEGSFGRKNDCRNRE